MPKLDQRLTNHRYCPHCKYDVHRTTYFRHKAQFYKSGKWQLTGSAAGSSEESFFDHDESQSKNRTGTKFCSHCNQHVSERTFYYHKSLDERSTDQEVDAEMSTENNCDEIVEFNTSQSLNNSAETEDHVESNGYKTSKTIDGRKKQQLFLECFVGNERNEEEDDDEEEGISSRLHDLWDNVSLEDLQNDVYSDSNFFEETNSISKKAIDLLHWIVLFISVWAAYFNISGNAVEHLLHFLKAVFLICGRSVPLFAIIATLFPSTLYSLYKLQGTEKDNFEKFVVCPDCMCIYSYNECIEIKNGKKQSKRCCYKRFPNHTHRTKRKPCNAILLKEITVKNGDFILYPCKMFCYRSLKKSLQLLLDKPQFIEKCEIWKCRVQVPGSYRDIYDGKVWKKFLTIETDDQSSRPFLSLPGHYGLLLNVDWFQPFKHSPYSVGVIYLVVVNLPRKERFKQQNVILLGLMPGPHEPSTHQMSFFLQNMTQELKELWFDGMEYKGSKYFAALIGCSCDLPAGRKLCGLLSFSAKIGCSKCTKQFKTKNFGEKTDYGGFDTWHPKRDYANIKAEAERAKNAKTASEQQAIEKATGCRWSELMDLPYFNAIEHLLLDPMHNLYLGISKFFCNQILPEHCNVTSDIWIKIQETVDNTKLPSDIGRIPYKISSNFSGFTADQHKNWILYFSLYTLKPYLSKEAYTVWKDFAEACFLFSRPVITVAQISKAHDKLMSFLKGFENWLGSAKSTPNFHMSTHLAEQILDYGSFYGYWCFAFERYNGVQGSYHTNNRSVELQMMRKFLRSCSLSNLSPPEEFSELASLLSFSNGEEGSLALSVIDTIPVENLQQLFKISEGTLNPSQVAPEIICDSSLVEMVGKGKNSYVDSISHKEFMCAAVKAYLGPEADQSVSGGFIKYSAIRYLGEEYGSVDGTMKRNCHVIVNSWLGIDGNIDCNSAEDRPAEILYFVKMFIVLNSVRRPIVLALVQWFQKHWAKNYYESEIAQVFAKSVYEIDGPASFVPIQKLKCKFVSGFPKIKGESVRVVIPRPPKIMW